MTEWNKIFVTLGVIGMYVGSSLHAQEANNEWANPAPIKKEEASFSHKREFELFDFSLDVIRATVQQTGLEYARVGSPATIQTNGNYVSPECNTAMGYRLGLGIDACDCWDMHLAWTRLRYNVVATQTASTTLAIEAILLPALTSVEIASADFTLRLDTIDATVGRKIRFDECFQVRPFMGVRYLELREDFDVTYIAGALPSDETPTLIEQEFSFRGLGGYCGSGIEVNIGCGVCLFGEWGIALLAGQQEVSLEQTQGPDETDVTDVSANFCATKAMADSKIGICWDCSACDGKLDISVRAAYEQQFVANVRELPILNTDGDLGTAGFSFGITVGF